MIKKIDSLTNPKIKDLKRLLCSSKARSKAAQFVLEGLRLCVDCATNSPVHMRAVFFTSELYATNERLIEEAFTGVTAYEISEAIAAKISDTENSQGIFLLCDIPEVNFGLNTEGKYIALENIQNPSNFGAVCRCVEAMGLDGIIVSGGVDFYNPKVLRSAMGSSLRLNIKKTASLRDDLVDFSKGGGRIFAAVPDRSAKSIDEAELSNGTIVVIGNEANGVSEETKRLCESVTIPMKGKAESLNAAAAAAIIAWELSK